MKLAFFGTPVMAAEILQGLMAADLTPVLVVSAPDAPVGRGLRLTPSPVSALAQERGLPLLRPTNVGTAAFRQALRQTGAEVAVVAAYGKVLGPRLLASLPHGFVNVHTSLLPRWRGASPAQCAILHGDEETGVSFMLLNEGLDTGPVLSQVAVPLLAADTPPVLLGRLTHAAVAHLPGVLRQWVAGQLMPTPQDETRATYAPKFTKADGVLDFCQGAVVLERRVRAVTPWPGARARLAGHDVVITQARLPGGEEKAQAAGLSPGALLSPKGQPFLLAGAGDGALVVERVKPAGKKEMAAADWLRGLRLEKPQFDLPG